MGVTLSLHLPSARKKSGLLKKRNQTTIHSVTLAFVFLKTSYEDLLYIQYLSRTLGRPGVSGFGPYDLTRPPAPSQQSQLLTYRSHSDCQGSYSLTHHTFFCVGLSCD